MNAQSADRARPTPTRADTPSRPARRPPQTTSQIGPRADYGQLPIIPSRPATAVTPLAPGFAAPTGSQPSLGSLLERRRCRRGEPAATELHLGLGPPGFRSGQRRERSSDRLLLACRPSHRLVARPARAARRFAWGTAARVAKGDADRRSSGARGIGHVETVSSARHRKQLLGTRRRPQALSLGSCGAPGSSTGTGGIRRLEL